MTVQNLFGDLALDATVQTIADAVVARLAVAGDKAMNIQSAKTTKFTWSFADAYTNSVDPSFATLLQTGSGMTVNQTGGNLVVTTGTTAYSETVIRSAGTFKGLGVVRWGLTLSQRIANNNFIVEWCDVIGDGLGLTINSATSITVTKTAHGFTSGDVGKGIWVGMCSVASCSTQRAVIASIPDANNITLTVTGYPASGSGTCSLFGYNFHQTYYSGTTATTLGTGYATQRQGWANAFTNATINTTASGHIGIMETSRSFDAAFLDQVVASGTSVQATQRATSNSNVPDEDVEMYLQIRVFNGSTAPASTTTATFQFVHGEMYNPLMVNLSGIQSFAGKNALPVAQQGTATVSLASTALAPSASYGSATYHHLISANTTNATSVKTSAGNINDLTLCNNGASAAYFKLYNKASAPTVGTDTPTRTVMIPAGQTVQIEFGAYGVRNTTGIAYALTGGMAVADTTAVAAAQVSVSLTYT